MKYLINYGMFYSYFMFKMGNKEDKRAVAGTISTAVTGIGIGILVIGTGGLAALPLSTEIAGVTNTISQSKNDQEFSTGSFAASAGLGAVTGLFTMGAGVAATNIAKLLVSKGQKSCLRRSICCLRSAISNTAVQL